MNNPEVKHRSISIIVASDLKGIGCTDKSEITCESDSYRICGKENTRLNTSNSLNNYLPEISLFQLTSSPPNCLK